MGDLVAPIKRKHRGLFSCGLCEGTGVEHQRMLPDADPIPTGSVCPNCDGSGAAPVIERALYGANLHDGIAGFGDTPAAAMTDFDHAWLTDRPVTDPTDGGGS